MAGFKATPFKIFLRRGDPMVWIAGTGFAMIGLMVLTLFGVILKNGIGVFWPQELSLIELETGERVLGEWVEREDDIKGRGKALYKVGNRDLYGADFKWLSEAQVSSVSYPKDAVALERMEYGNFYGFLRAVTPLPGMAVDQASPTEDLWQRFDRVYRYVAQQQKKVEAIRHELEQTNNHIGRITARERQEYFQSQGTTRGFQAQNPALARLKYSFEQKVAASAVLKQRLLAYTAQFSDVAGTVKSIPMMDIVRYYLPNQMNLWQKMAYYGERIRELLWDDPRESNTEGGLFPAIFGTVALILIMSILTFPLGVLAGIYLHEYAKDGIVVRMVRIAVNNLASIPAIVFGIFGLGFFIYGVGSTIDQIFFADRLPEPTFGTGGILWASMTLGILTIPVVIVATEEALSAIPRAIRENSFALGATKFQTLWRICLPAAASGIMTGFILAMARAAGEVAPLMITGVVKMAPTLAIDGTWPFFHAERKFMHLGFHIYDISFQSPNVEAAKPMVYVTTLLLIVIVVLMSGIAIFLRERLKKKFKIHSI